MKEVRKYGFAVFFPQLHTSMVRTGSYILSLVGKCLLTMQNGVTKQVTLMQHAPSMKITLATRICFGTRSTGPEHRIHA
jgi:hypothetical protein